MRRRRGGRGPVALPKPDSPEDRGKAEKKRSRSRSGEFSGKLAGSNPLLDASPVRQCFRPRCTDHGDGHSQFGNAASSLRLGNAPSYSPVSRCLPPPLEWLNPRPTKRGRAAQLRIFGEMASVMALSPPPVDASFLARHNPHLLRYCSSSLSPLTCALHGSP